jgi:hypothetical protein
LEDVVPTYIFLILNDIEKHESHLYIKHILKDENYFLSDTESECSNPNSQNPFVKENITQEIQDQVENNKIRRHRRRSSENFEISLIDKKAWDVKEKIDRLALES